MKPWEIAIAVPTAGLAVWWCWWSVRYCKRDPEWRDDEYVG